MVVDRARRALLRREARKAEEDGNWLAAAGLWQRLLASTDNPSADLLVRVGRSLRRAEQTAPARDVFARAVARAPNDLVAVMNLAYAAILDEDWDEAMELSQLVLDRFPDQASPRAWRRAVEVALKTEDVPRAEQYLRDGLERFGRVPEMLIAEARVAAALADHDRALDAWTELLATEATAPASAYAEAARHSMLAGRYEEARDLAQRGVRARPDSATLHRLLAGGCFTVGDWAGALAAWSAYASVSLINSALPGLPLQSSAGHWHVGHWERAGRALVEGSVDPQQIVGSAVWVAVARNVALRSPALAADVLRIAEAHVGDLSGIGSWRRRFEIEADRPGPGRPVPSEELRPGPAEDALVRALSVLAPPEGDDWGPVPVVAVQRGSEAELELRRLRHLDREAVEDLVAEVSAQSAWVETREGVAVAEASARAHSDEFARRYADELHVPHEALSDALFLQLEQALFTLEPVRRIARWFAEQDSSTPVLVRLPSWRISMFGAYDIGQFWAVALVTELRREGVPAAALVYRDEPRTELRALGPFRFAVHPTLLAAREPEHQREELAETAVFPSGIRSVIEVIRGLDDPLVFAGDSIVGSFAYDRSHRGRVEYEPSVSTLAERSMFGERVWPLHRVDWQAEFEDMSIWATPALGTDLLGLARELIGDHLSETYRRTLTVVREQGICEGHVADHHYAGSGLFAGAVRATGGTIVLWPHSTNPVHVTSRPRGSFSEVAAITAQGAEWWREHHPDAIVKHRPDLMLGWSARPAPVNPEAPLHVVVIGGMPVLGLTPWLDLSEHDRTVRSFMLEIEQLRRSGDLRIAFKAKGGGVGGAAWLDGLVGDDVQFDVVARHPLRLELPNMLFVTISQGSSAIYEGISRAIPGLVVRDFPVVDYTTLSDGATPIRGVAGALDVVRSCTSPQGRAALSQAQVAALTVEVGHGPSWHAEPLAVGGGRSAQR